jgi:biopolymer transport protein ExbB
MLPVVVAIVTLCAAAVADAQDTTGAATSSPSTGGTTDQSFPTELPSEVPDEPPPPAVRPQGSFMELAMQQGGAIFWILIVLAAGGIVVAVERLLSLGGSRIDVTRFMGEVGRALQDKGVNGALEACSRYKGPVCQVVQYGLQRAARGPEAVEKAVSTAALSQIVGMRRGLGILSFVGQAAPLLGFLGTVMGLLHAFDAAVASGRVQAPQAIGGISEAVVTTTTGIAIAILANILINLISARIDRLTVQMEEAGDELVEAVIQSRVHLKGRTA